MANGNRIEISEAINLIVSGQLVVFFAQSLPQLAYSFMPKICPVCTSHDEITWADLYADRVELCIEHRPPAPNPPAEREIKDGSHFSRPLPRKLK